MVVAAAVAAAAVRVRGGCARPAARHILAPRAPPWALTAMHACSRALTASRSVLKTSRTSAAAAADRAATRACISPTAAAAAVTAPLRARTSCAMAVSSARLVPAWDSRKV